MDVLVLERTLGKQQEQQCLVSGQRAALEDAARQQARRQARVYGWRAAVASLAATALLLGGYALGLVCL